MLLQIQPTGNYTVGITIAVTVMLALAVAAAGSYRVYRKKTDFFTKRYRILVGLVVFLGLCAAGWKYIMGIGVNEGYMPVQPIAMNHRIHYTDNGIDCQYCHSGAADYAQAGIPSMDVCMNCHREIRKGTNTGREEIAKIYEAAGYDPATNTYNPDKERPVQWARVTMLPPHVHFDHSQHVGLGKLDCAECHGDVGQMDNPYQSTPMTMSWCIDCHRRSKVDVRDNSYYRVMRDDLTPEQVADGVNLIEMGGQECGRCHH